MKIYFNQDPVGNLDDVLDLYSEREFQSPTRSTVPLLSLLKDDSPMKRLLRILELTNDSFKAHLEYEVGPFRGEGEASHTDLMLIQNGNAFAIEAKWTEPPYDSVEQWLGRGRTPANRREVMLGWLGCLQRYAVRKLDIGEFGAATYQMVHRAASACAECDVSGRPALAYLQFSPLPNDSEPHTELLKDGLSHLYHLLGAPSNFAFLLIEVTAIPTEAFVLISGLRKGSSETARAVIGALGGAPLFRFSDFRTHLSNSRK